MVCLVVMTQVAAEQQSQCSRLALGPYFAGSLLVSWGWRIVDSIAWNSTRFHVVLLEFEGLLTK